MIEIAALTKQYGDVSALRGIDLSVFAGEMFALLGPNGAGKTSLFSILATLRRPSGGSARILGLDVLRSRREVRKRIGIVFQEPALALLLSPRLNLLLMGLLCGLAPTPARRRADELLASFDLLAVARRPCKTLSGGQRRRVELARAQVSRPPVLFLDEPTVGLDEGSRRSYWHFVRSMANAGATIFYTTHYMDEADRADRIAIIDGGKVVALGAPAELKQRVRRPALRLRVADPARASLWLEAHAIESTVQNHEIVISHDAPEVLASSLLRSLPTRVHNLVTELPTLQDVFWATTGRQVTLH